MNLACTSNACRDIIAATLILCLPPALIYEAQANNRSAPGTFNKLWSFRRIFPQPYSSFNSTNSIANERTRESRNLSVAPHV
jgi:hypothetical protein